MKNLKNIDPKWTYAIVLVVVVACALFLMSRRAEGYEEAGAMGSSMRFRVTAYTHPRGQVIASWTFDVPAAGLLNDFVKRVRYMNSLRNFPNGFDPKVFAYVVAQSHYLLKLGQWSKLPYDVQGGDNGIWGNLRQKMLLKGVRFQAYY